MKAVIYGAGNIGRGFIGVLFRQSGYEVTFIDVAKPLIAELNERGEYPVRMLTNAGHEDLWVDGVRAVDGSDREAVAGQIADADLMATAVGVPVLRHIAPYLAAGIRARFARGARPLNIILCENLLDADQYLGGLIQEALSAEEGALMRERIGLVEASIGRMVPVQTEAMKDGDPLRVCVEPYGYLPVDAQAFRGEIPAIQGLVPYSPFGYYIKRKLFLHNMGHSLLAYLGLYCGYEFIWQAIEDPEILILVKNAMQESAAAIARAYEMPLQDLLAHTNDLLNRFTNRALGDTCARVGADTSRKLGPSDRLIGAVRLCESWGLPSVHGTIGIGAALYRHLQQMGRPQTEENAREVLSQISEVGEGDPLGDAALRWYGYFSAGTRPQQLRMVAADELARSTGAIV